MRRAFKTITILVTFCFFSSCGYQFVSSSSQSIGLSFINGDEHGYLTKKIIEQVEENGYYTYQNEKYDYLLMVDIKDFQNETIGYRRDKEKDLSVRENIIADEGRVMVSASVQIIDEKTQETILGPVNITSYADYDYVDENSLQDLSFINLNGVRQTVLSFSLGQLESEFSAQTAALKPLYDQLSQKIVDVIVSKMIED